MTYTFTKHLHNYACWTAARAVQRNFTTTDKIIKAIETSDLMRVEELQIETPTRYDYFHSICCNQIIDYFVDELELTASYGQAAKIVAVYLKTAVIIRYSGEGKLASLAHPPIDTILLTNLHKKHPELEVNNINWTELDEASYFDLISKLRSLPLNRFWELEEYWDAANEKAYSVEDSRVKSPNAYAPWSKEDDQKLELLYCEDKKTTELMSIFHRNKGAIESRIKKLGLKEKYGK